MTKPDPKFTEPYLTLPEQLNLIKKAKQKIYLKKNWTTGVFARGANGNPINSGNENATCWCALGAVYSLVSNIHKRFAVNETIFRCSPTARKYGDVGTANDVGGHRIAIRILNETIKALEAELKAETNAESNIS